MEHVSAVVVRMWKEAPHGAFRARIIVADDVPGEGRKRTIVVSSAEAALDELRTILRSFDAEKPPLRGVRIPGSFLRRS